jgi:hypothetical protein
MLQDMRVLLALAALTPLVAQEVDPTEALMRLRDRLLAHGERIPNHTCVETVTRDYYEPTIPEAPKSCDALFGRRKETPLADLLRLAKTDRLRLDVVLAENRELLSWAGAPRFDEGELDEVIPDGAMGTGAFAAMLLGIFQSPQARYFWEGESKLDGRAALEYSFSVPVEASRYRVKTGREWIRTAYTGSLWLDAKTAELIRMTVRTDELPAGSHSCETRTTLDYGAVRLGDTDYALPSKATQRFFGRDGSESENTVTFASCREYRGESTLRFGAPVTPAGPAAPVASQAPWPAGLPVTIDLESTVHSGRAAAGDVIYGRLAKAVAGTPAGATVEGRLMRVELRHGARPQVTISLRWETIDGNGARAPLALVPRTATLPRGGRVEIVLPAVSDARYGVYHFPGAQAVMEAGFRTEWTTARP